MLLFLLAKETGAGFESIESAIGDRSPARLRR